MLFLIQFFDIMSTERRLINDLDKKLGCAVMDVGR